MTDLALVTLVAGGTLIMRASLVALLAGVTIPQRGEQAFRLVAPAVLAGLVAQTLFLTGGDIRPIDSWYVAAAAAAIVAIRTRTVGWTLVVGMATIWLLEAVV